jgi:hypothetical protein
MSVASSMHVECKPSAARLDPRTMVSLAYSCVISNLDSHEPPPYEVMNYDGVLEMVSSVVEHTVSSLHLEVSPHCSRFPPAYPGLSP